MGWVVFHWDILATHCSGYFRIFLFHPIRSGGMVSPEIAANGTGEPPFNFRQNESKKRWKATFRMEISDCREAWRDAIPGSHTNTPPKFPNRSTATLRLHGTSVPLWTPLMARIGT
jgi:hypothetical protein